MTLCLVMRGDFGSTGILRFYFPIGDERMYIKASQVADRLGNDYEIVRDPPILLDHRSHPYRFVFVDGCLAGGRGLWADAFGIPTKELKYAQLRNHPERAQAFLGFKVPILH